jgi:hypothetical protein
LSITALEDPGISRSPSNCFQSCAICSVLPTRELYWHESGLSVSRSDALAKSGKDGLQGREHLNAVTIFGHDSKHGSGDVCEIGWMAPTRPPGFIQND